MEVPMTERTGRVALFHAPCEPFELTEVRVPRLEDAAALVRVRLAPVCGSDLHAWRGTQGVQIPPGGYILGHEMVGEVVELGRLRQHDALGHPMHAGDRVVFPYFFPCGSCPACMTHRPYCCPTRRLANLDRDVRLFPHFVGGFAEYYYVRPNQTLFRVPDAVPDEWAASANCAMAQAWHALRLSGLTPGDRLVVQGLGGVGLAAVMFARAWGAGQVIGIDASAERLAAARAFGADDALALGAAGGVRAAVCDLTGGGADLVLGAAGSATAFADALGLVRDGGRITEVGTITRGRPVSIDPAEIVWRNLKVIGSLHYDPLALGEVLSFLSRHPGKLQAGGWLSAVHTLDELSSVFEAAAHGEPSSRRLAIAP
jgi:threonine dehydrogenase-like Zn-dependent dehydrogenase